MFNQLAKRLAGVFDKIRSRGILTAEMVDESMREIKVALLEADVALPVVKSFIASVKEKAVGQDIIRAVSPVQQVIKIVNDALIETLGSDNCELLRAKVSPSIILMLGLQGSGKTTSCGKLALRLKKNGLKVLMASLDIYRPAAQEQLAGLGGQIGVDTLPIVEGQKPQEITKRACQAAKAGAYDYLILDTAGRLHIDEEKMAELKQVEQISQPVEKLLVVDALTGQDAVQVANHFHEAVGITGLILTRMDGDSRGGAALSVRQMTGQPIKFLGVGEKTEALEVFDAARVAGRILDKGDVVGLVETAMEKMDQQAAMEQTERLTQGKFDMNDMLSYLQQIDNMGDIKGLMMMIPGMSKFREKIENAQIDNKVFKRQAAICLSMTPYERKHPDVLKAARKQRIAKGAGVTVNDVNKLLAQYDQMAKVCKKFKKMGPLSSMRMMQKMSSMARGKNPLMNGGGFPF